MIGVSSGPVKLVHSQFMLRSGEMWILLRDELTFYIGVTMKRTITLVFCTLFVMSCSSSTLISTTDPDARIYVDGEYLGNGEAYYTDQKVAFSKNEVTIRKDGCEPQYHEFRRSERADIGAIVGGLFFTVPFLWATEYKNFREYEYACDAQI